MATFGRFWEFLAHLPRLLACCDFCRNLAQCKATFLPSFGQCQQLTLSLAIFGIFSILAGTIFGFLCGIFFSRINSHNYPHSDETGIVPLHIQNGHFQGEFWPATPPPPVGDPDKLSSVGADLEPNLSSTNPGLEIRVGVRAPLKTAPFENSVK